MKVVHQNSFLEKEKETLWQLRNNEYPIQLGHETFQEFEIYVNAILEMDNYLLIDSKNEIQGWAYTFFRDEEIWFAIMLNYQFQGKGYGRILLEEIKKKNQNLNGWVIDHGNDFKRNKENYKSPLEFYVLNGFSVLNDIRLENEIISAVKINWKNNK
ncbi:hypothetical protein [Flavobacterium sharifuzzamanii]|uniref:hypothetical protein n=1 Tax=Flavobacterium sharifuzzamanii TaxID=2211133 RepID=UPI000DAD5951|nr:hypothetical protein [Flavobacterium sharifuzzamanii]KAF2080611.1 hypothetical protein DMA14_15045 [Flavobacterium sharifuzzamanii]